MYSRSAATAYRRVDLESAPSYQIVDRLYERFARDMEHARAAILAKDIHVKARELDHALCIVVHTDTEREGAGAVSGHIEIIPCDRVAVDVPSVGGADGCQIVRQVIADGHVVRVVTVVVAYGNRVGQLVGGIVRVVRP